MPSNHSYLRKITCKHTYMREREETKVKCYEHLANLDEGYTEIVCTVFAFIFL